MEGCCEVPLVERLRAVPKGYRTWIASQWAENGAETGHTHIPVGIMMHEAAAEIESLKAQLAEANNNHESVIEEWKAAMREVERLQAEISECRDKALEEAAQAGRGAVLASEDLTPLEYIADDLVDAIRFLKGTKP